MDEGHGMIKAYIDGAMNPKTKKSRGWPSALKRCPTRAIKSTGDPCR